MDIIKVPDGETRKSFITARIKHLERQHDLYKFMLDDVGCYDNELQKDMIQLELRMLDLIKKLKGML